MKPTVIVIAAVGEWNDQRYIGEANQMPWQLPRDLRFFKTVTDGSVVVMGRKTFESLGCRVLPNRRNIVVTRQSGFHVKGGEVAHSLQEAIELASNSGYVFVIGGGEIYRQALPLADHLLITQIKHTSGNETLFDVFRGDTFFPSFSDKEWEMIKASRWFKATSAKSPAQIERSHAHNYPLQFRFLRFDRIQDQLQSRNRSKKLFFGQAKLYRKRASKAETCPVSSSNAVQLKLLDNNQH